MFDLNKRSGTKESPEPPELPEAEPRFPDTRSKETSSGTRVREAAIIGPSIHIDGDLRGEEDLIIEGEVKGTIHLSEHSLTVGSKGKIQADVYAHTIVVDGTLDGDLYGAERVAIRKNGQVRGNIVSPRVSLEDGGRFKGSVEMDEEAIAKVFGRTTDKRPQEPAASSSPASGGTGASASSTPRAGESPRKTETGESAGTATGSAAGASPQGQSGKSAGGSGKGGVGG